MQNSTPLAWLIGNEGTPGEVRFELTGSETTLGRGSDCEIQVDDQHASRQHAAIHFFDGGYQIKDLDSSNGTFVNDKRITSLPLSEGDKIQIGDSILRVRLEQDLDATIIQKISPQSTSTASVTIPREPVTGHCRQCGQPNPKGGKFCIECGAPLPQLPGSFQKTQKTFTEAQASYKAGQLTREEYQSTLTKLVVQDDQGEYWMLGVESGDWYWYDGEEWNLRNPPLILPEDELPTPPTPPAPQQPGQLEDSHPKPPKQGRWGVIGLWLFSALIILALGVYTVIELVTITQGRSENQLVPKSQGVIEEPLDSIDPASEESDLPSAAATPTIYAQDIKNDLQVRPYNPSTDSSLLSLTEDTEYLPEQSTEEYFIRQGSFPLGESGILIMGWCAIDQTTLESNMAAIQMEGTLDGITIPQSMWTLEDSQVEGMFCRYHRIVVEDLEAGIHHYFWSTSYNETIFDGWDTYSPGTNINEYIIEIKEQYGFVDDFKFSEGHWGETNREEVQVWIEGGELHIELYIASVGAMSHFRDREFDDFTMITQARSLSETPGYYGIVFRHQDVDNYYFFEISDEGSFRLGKRIGETIDLIPWTPSDAILMDGGVNRLAVSMEGDSILALINGELVADLHDSSIQEGKLCLIAEAPQGVETFHAAFQQVSIDAPE